ncbi:MAG: tRNA (adenosine(37)-N6)-threonylcarbamoyltransferase complex dimerization subunit type 1 TsaB [Pseudomonadota bacterium]
MNRTLAIETASAACSVALFEDGEILAHDHREIGRGHAERLVPMIAAMPDTGRAARILVSLGPGSFTGVRIGIATARALGFAWGADVQGYPTLALIAAQARARIGAECPVSVCMNGGHGEWFFQNFAATGPEDSVRSLTPEAAKAACRHNLVAGNRAEELAALFEGTKTPLSLLPDARATLLLPETQLTSNLAPIYGRGPDATPQKVPAKQAS